MALGLANLVIGSENIDQELEQIEASIINDNSGVKFYQNQEFKDNFLMFSSEQAFIRKMLEKSTVLEKQI